MTTPGCAGSPRWPCSAAPGRYEPAPLASGALNAAGTRAAFPQPDGTVLTVDLTGTGHRSYRMDTGTVQAMWWVGDDDLVVGTTGLTRVLDLHSGTNRLLPG